MTRNRKGYMSTHAFAWTLLGRRDEYVRGWVFGRWSIFFDTGRPVPNRRGTP